MKRSHRRNIKITVVVLSVLLLAIIGSLAYLYYNNKVVPGTLGINGYYDANGKLIPQGFFSQSVIGNVDGVRYITFAVNVKDEDTYPATFTIIDASPVEFKNALQLNSNKTASSGQSVTWTSGLIDVKPYENSSLNVSVTIRATSAFRASVDKTAKLAIEVKPDMPLSFSINLNSSVNNDPNYQPPTQGGSMFETNAIGGWPSYASGTWIRVDKDNNGVLEQYSYTSTSSCIFSGLRLITTSTDGFNIYDNGAGAGILLRRDNTLTDCKLYLG